MHKHRRFGTGPHQLMSLGRRGSTSACSEPLNRSMSLTFTSAGGDGMHTPISLRKSHISCCSEPSCWRACAASARSSAAWRRCWTSRSDKTAARRFHRSTPRMMEKVSLALASPRMLRIKSQNALTLTSPLPSSTKSHTLWYSEGGISRTSNFAVTSSFSSSAASYSSLESMPLPSESMSSNKYANSRRSFANSSRFCTASASSSLFARCIELSTMAATTRLRRTRVTTAMTKMTKGATTGDFDIKGRATSNQLSKVMIWNNVNIDFGTSPK
mmetsp:Transcript_11318/g.32181  ORF Transcript_11318/g.32181 Transcript_11318/m.32181 type:complete len:272 (-) Transcript_11318:1162-1977(-)